MKRFLFLAVRLIKDLALLLVILLPTIMALRAASRVQRYRVKRAKAILDARVDRLRNPSRYLKIYPGEDG